MDKTFSVSYLGVSSVFLLGRLESDRRHTTTQRRILTQKRHSLHIRENNPSLVRSRIFTLIWASSSPILGSPHGPYTQNPRVSLLLPLLRFTDRLGPFPYREARYPKTRVFVFFKRDRRSILSHLNFVLKCDPQHGVNPRSNRLIN